MDAIARSSESSGSTPRPLASIASETAAFRTMLEQLEAEREVTREILSDAVRWAACYVGTLDVVDEAELTPRMRTRRELCRAHLAHLRAFLEGAFDMPTRES